MKKLLLLFSILLSILASAQNANDHYKMLSVLQGTWSMQTKRGIVYENWQLREGYLEGKSFRVNGVDTALLEKVTIVIKGNDLFYIPIVEGQNNGEAVRFKLVSTTNETFIFDNPDHDFPQRVIYQLPKNDVLHAWIEGLDKGVYRKSDFYYKKAK